MSDLGGLSIHQGGWHSNRVIAHKAGVMENALKTVTGAIGRATMTT